MLGFVKTRLAYVASVRCRITYPLTMHPSWSKALFRTVTLDVKHISSSCHCILLSTANIWPKLLLPSLLLYFVYCTFRLVDCRRRWLVNPIVVIVKYNVISLTLKQFNMLLRFCLCYSVFCQMFRMPYGAYPVAFF